MQEAFVGIGVRKRAKRTRAEGEAKTPDVRRESVWFRLNALRRHVNLRADERVGVGRAVELGGNAEVGKFRFSAAVEQDIAGLYLQAARAVSSGS